VISNKQLQPTDWHSAGYQLPHPAAAELRRYVADNPYVTYDRQITVFRHVETETLPVNRSHYAFADDGLD